VIRTRSKAIAAIAALILIPAAYFTVVAYLLSRSTLQMYGFPVSPDCAPPSRSLFRRVYVGCAIHDSGLLIFGNG